MNSKRQLTDVPLFGPVSTRNLSIGFLVVTAASYTMLSVAARLLSEGFQPMTQVYLRIALGTLALSVILRKSLRWKRFLTMPGKDILTVLTMGTIGYSVAVYFVTLGAINAKLVNVSVIFASVPFFSYLYAFLFLKKKFDAKLTTLLAVSVIGIAMVATKSFVPHLEAFGAGEWFTLLATATMAWFFVGRKVLSPHLNTSEITIAVMSVAAVSGFFIALVRGEPIPLSAFSNGHVLLGLFLGAFMNALVNPIEIFAFKHLDAVTGSQVLLLETVFSLIFGFLFYRELIGPAEIVGGLIIIGSVWIANKLPQ